MIPPTPRVPLRRVDKSPFLRGDDWRPLTFVVDDESLSESDHRILEALVGETMNVVHAGGSELPRIEPKWDGRDDDLMSVYSYSEAGVGLFGVHGVSRLRRDALTTTSESNLSGEETWRWLVFAEAGSTVNRFDGFVTRRPFLLDLNKPRVFSFEDAIALVGLVLRLQGRGSLGRDMWLGLDGSFFHFALAREVTPSGWRWFSACIAHSKSGEDTLLNLGQTTLERLTRVLQIRDRLHAEAKKPNRTFEVGDEMTFQFESFLLFLQAAFDTAARVAHVTYIDSNYENAGWRRPQWRDALPPEARHLNVLTADGTRGGVVLQLVSELRNTIHGEALPRVMIASGPIPGVKPQLSEKQSAKLEQLIGQLGETPEAWGIDRQSGSTYLETDRYVEALLPHAVEVLDTLMAATKVEETLAPEAVATLMSSAPDNSDEEDQTFTPAVRERVRLLGGL